MLTLGERIKIARKNEKQEDFARAIGISRGTLSLYERNEGYPNSDTLLRIAAYCNVSPAWLLTGQGSAQTMEQDGLTMEPVLERLGQAMCAQNFIQIAEMLDGVTSNMVLDLRNAQTLPTWVIKAAQKYNISMNWLLFGTEEKQCVTPARNASIPEATNNNACLAEPKNIHVTDARVTASHCLASTQSENYGLQQPELPQSNNLVAEILRLNQDLRDARLKLDALGLENAQLKAQIGKITAVTKD